MSDLSDITGKLDRLKEEPSFFVETVIGVDPFGYQKGFLNADSDYKCFLSGRQVGKSRVCSWKALHAVATRPGATIFLTAPTQNQAMELSRQVHKEINEAEIPKDYWGIEKDTKSEIEFQNGSRLLFWTSGTEGGNIRGLTVDCLIIDEAAFIDDQIYYDVLTPMTATTDEDIYLFSTPHGTTGFFYEAYENDPDFYTQQVASMDSPLIEEEYIERQHQQLTDLQFKQEILGEFEESSAAFFAKDDVEGCVEKDVEQEIDVCFLGADLARYGMDRSVFISIDGHGNVFDIEYTTEMPLTDAVGRIKQLDEEHNYDKVFLDETGLGSGGVDMLMEDLHRRKVKGLTFSIDKKQSLYNTLKNAMQDGSVRYPDHPYLTKELIDLEYQLTRTGKTKIHHPDDGHDDFTDALALAVWALEESTRRNRGSRRVHNF